MIDVCKDEAGSNRRMMCVNLGRRRGCVDVPS